MTSQRTQVALLSVLAMLGGLAWTSPCVHASTWIGRVAEGIEKFYEKHGKFPDRLEEIRVYMEPRDPGFLFDYWEQPYWYQRVGDSYELFSVGPDGLPETDDDIRPGEPWVSCGFTPQEVDRILREGFCDHPCDQASNRLWRIRYEIRWFRSYWGVEPMLLEELGDQPLAGTETANGTGFVDPWGERYVFDFGPHGMEVYSKGPDRTAFTSDDVVPEIFWDFGCMAAVAAAEREAEARAKARDQSGSGCGCSFVRP